MKARRLVCVLLLCAVTIGCNKYVGGHAVDETGAPQSLSLESRDFLAAIDATTGTNVVDVVGKFQRIDQASEPSKDQYETTVAWKKHVADSGVHLPYGPGFTAVIKSADLSSDAESGTASFAAADPDGSIPDDHLTFNPLDTPPPRSPPPEAALRLMG